MKTFLQNLTLARVLIIVSLACTLGVGLFAWNKKQELDVLRQNLAVDMPQVSKSLLELGQRHSMLSRSLKGDGLSAQANPLTYITNIGLKDNVDIGEFVPSPRETFPSGAKGIVDKQYSIVPTDKTRTFDRLRLINFLFSLEEGSRRVKVTHLKLTNATKRVKPHEIPDDGWTYEAEVTSRQRADG